MAKLRFTDGREIYVDEKNLVAEITSGEREYGRDILEYDPFANPGDDVTLGDVAAALRIARIRTVKPGDLRRAIARKKAVAATLQRLEFGVNLFALKEARVPEVIDGFARTLIGSLAELKHVNVALATKILHLKRAALFPILDHYIFAFYSYIYNERNKERNVETAVRLLKEFRADGRNNINVLQRLAARMSEAANEKLAAGQRVALSPARALDRLIWRHVKKRTG